MTPSSNGSAAGKSPEAPVHSPTRPVPGLRDFYEDPTVPVASGEARSLRQARMLADALGPAGPGRPAATVLDVGCGDGSAAATAARVLKGHRIVGVDWSQDALRRAAPRLSQVVRGELTGGGLPFASGSADAVLFSEVVEHLVDPDSALDELHRVLRPGGHLMLSTPNLAAWYNRGLLLAGVQPVFSEVSLRHIHGRPGSQVVGHLRLYTARALREFVAASGFEVVTVAGAPFHGVPRPLRPLDRLACRLPSLASILLVHARKV
ncbi:methyltransferase domain-containing protein [Streptomyces lunaelactis]|uniref:class I SAM-dependent methyltransferase n=1 Tax=Streptomyces lunaelactis TaxID=1535768 RepID=UPI0015855047|nr:class I SAM-dependent methyltransferase [Streptomyces lunaelactis]NUK32966.1 methyltransferase domain-containing protein [Streptomyces lunaelactis]NUK42036.1 methyltransferase domain-containing protein [Streptomyces lunaelactis]NUK70010.1 methyltransferase domain-containing protein [Streptomyces lunaelactis]NUK93002.1 methyltransferase domain-containing protein [Streptomyces lunaelactis]NUL31275.1 methyltransferase domain-containing protein [Streptomyces lunaelactis]